jgi:hypothetical protein
MNKLLMIVPNGVSPQGTDVRNHVPMGAISVIGELNDSGYSSLLLDCVGEARKQYLLGERNEYFWDEYIDGEYFRKTGLHDDEILNRLVKQKRAKSEVASCNLL